MMEVLKELLSTNTNVGRVEWIGCSPASRAPISAVDTIAVVKGGLQGDYHCRPNRSSKRQVTLIQAEHLPFVAALLGRDSVAPSDLRRNLVVSGINLAALKYQRFQIGTAVLEGSGNCPPCSRMEENLGSGGYAAMLGHGGITAIVMIEGTIRLQDNVHAILTPRDSSGSE
jgi:MOSC domain-containing protein YiiM